MTDLPAALIALVSRLDAQPAARVGAENRAPGSVRGLMKREILLLRELLIVYSGNELCIGIILANWLILEAFGCFFLGREAERSKNELETFTVLSILFSLSLFIAIFLTRIMKSIIGIAIGESVGFFPMFYSSFLILLPVAIFHGALFTSSCRIYSMFSGQAASSAGRVYVYETVGTLIGGIVCTYLLIPYLNTFQAFSGLALLNFFVCLVLLAPYRKTGLVQKTILVSAMEKPQYRSLPELPVRQYLRCREPGTIHFLSGRCSKCDNAYSGYTIC
jgi:hypothetical protein